MEVAQFPQLCKNKLDPCIVYIHQIGPHSFQSISQKKFNLSILYRHFCWKIRTSIWNGLLKWFYATIFNVLSSHILHLLRTRTWSLPSFNAVKKENQKKKKEKRKEKKATHYLAWSVRVRLICVRNHGSLQWYDIVHFEYKLS